MPEPIVLPWLEPDHPFPAPHRALSDSTSHPGLLAAGGDLSPQRLVQAYSQGIFPWFSAGQPILWWSPEPRMVLTLKQFRFHRSLRQTVKQWQREGRHRLTIDQDFAAVIRHCAQTPRPGQPGTWIVPAMQSAYRDLHEAGHAHSIEVWEDDELIGGLYAVNLGQAVFGESMFALRSNASKVALCALVALCRDQGAEWIDCQQQTAHLASLGARALPRADFIEQVKHACRKPNLLWQSESIYWDRLLMLDRPA